MIRSIIERFKIPIILLVVLMLGLIGITVIPQQIKLYQTKDSPIKDIEVINKKIYKAEEEINPKDFTIILKHENGINLQAKKGTIELSTSQVEATGAETEVEVTYTNGDVSFTKEVVVQTERNEITSYNCGSPNKADVRAVLYSNGELSFEGKGDIQEFGERNFPWLTDQIIRDHPIVSISFEDGVRPVSLDSCFEGIQTLLYVGKLPDSVETMVGTFAGCTSLKVAPSMKSLNRLIDMDGCFSGCESLVTPPDVPENLRNASNAFKGCVSLSTTPDFSKCGALTNLTSAFSGCSKLTKITLPQNVIYLDNAFEQCINLRNMPEIPESVLYMDSAFYGDISLRKVTIIPRNVERVSSCFYDCAKIDGVLWIDGNPSEYNSFLTGAANATLLDLQGNSKMLEVLANTGHANPNITVNGKLPDPDAKYDPNNTTSKQIATVNLPKDVDENADYGNNAQGDEGDVQDPMIDATLITPTPAPEVDEYTEEDTEANVVDENTIEEDYEDEIIPEEEEEFYYDDGTEIPGDEVFEAE